MKNDVTPSVPGVHSSSPPTSHATNGDGRDEPPQSSQPVHPSFEPGDPSHYLNRELSWLEFNARVLEEAASEEVPLFERVKFLGIFISNLDEFFMVRVAGLQAQQGRTIADLPPDGLAPAEQLTAIATRAHALVERAYQLWNDELLPGLRRAKIFIVKPEELDAEELAILDERFKADIFPVLTPLAIDPGHPFPHLRNKNINLGIMFTREHEGEQTGFGVIQLPTMLNRLLPVRMAGAERAFVLLEDLVARHVREFFQATRIRGTYPFRVTRNWDLEIDEEEGEDLLQTIQAELRRRDRGNAVRVELSFGAGTDASVMRLCKALNLDLTNDVYKVNGPLNFADLIQVVSDDPRREFKDDRFTPQVAGPLRDADDLFAVIRERDVLLHHPYDSFDPVVEFLNQAADDPNVLAIKQTLYRTGGDSPIAKALARAAENGKQVTAVVELKARFDEASNIRWAHTLEQSGAQVIYGLLGLKTHVKALLVVRREKERLRRYAHLSTGNYNPQTARLYTDLSLFTANREIGEDVTALFNLLTGYSAPPKWNRLIVAPLGLHEAILGLIARETAHARAGRRASIVAQMNSLVDVDVIDALYGASEAGVDIQLRIRGICCLRPGIPGLSSRIVVQANVDRFLEHERVFRFENGGNEEHYFSSADWMPRNFHRRVEILVPVLDPKIKHRINDIMGTLFADVGKSWVLDRTGSYTKRTLDSAATPPPPPVSGAGANGPPSLHSDSQKSGVVAAVASQAGPFRAQQRFIELARERAKGSDLLKGAGGRFHILSVPSTEEDRKLRRDKERQKKKRIM